jgi:hypothetical protein
MKATAIWLVALLAIASAGCSAAWEARRAALNAPAADVKGTWTGTTTGEDKPFPITLTLEQNGKDVTGTMRIAGRPDLSGRVQGTVRGEVLDLSLTTAAHVGGELWVQQDNMMTSNAFELHFTLRRSR